MKFEVDRGGFRIVPENAQDIAFIEDTLGLRNSGARIDLVRVNIMGLGAIDYLETRHRPAPEMGKVEEFIMRQVTEK